MYPLHSDEGRIHRTIYPSTAGGGLYYTPWLWQDGYFNGYNLNGSTYSTWRTKINNRLNIPSPVTMTMWGTYSFYRGSGTIYAKFHNDTTFTLKGKVFWAITEDSIYYSGPNGDPWHNHVVRDYLGDPLGQFYAINSHDSLILSQPFTIQSGWNSTRCKILAWFQDTALTIIPPYDTMKTVYQSSQKKISELVGIEENSTRPLPRITLTPNPCRDGTRFRFTIPLGSNYRIRIFDITGRQISELSGISRSDIETAAWDLHSTKGELVNSGVYLYRFESPTIKTNGKIVVK
jgi:hypothetical protein